MLNCILCIGAPGAGKSFWAKAEVAKDPNNVVRVNNDDIRSMLNDSVFSPSTEKLVSRIRENIIHNALKYGKSVIVDNVNSNKEHFETCVAIAKSLNKDILVTEKPFYEELSVLMERDSKREGKSRVGEIIVKKFFNALGGKQFKNYQPRVETITQTAPRDVEPMVQDESKEDLYLVDLDGTVCNISHRTSPYAANECLNDKPVKSVIDTIISLYETGKKIIFMSGRSDEFRELSEQWINKFIQCNGNKIDYKLYMRKAGDFRADQIIKKELFETHIKNKYYVIAIFDDRPKVVKMWRSIGLTVFQLNDVEF